MFILRKILNGRTNVSEPLSMAAGVADETTFAAGTAVAYADGVLAPVTGDATAEYIVAATTTCKSATDRVPLILVTPDMLFEVPLTAPPTEMKVGSKYTLGTDGVGVTATAVTNGKGACVVDLCGATKTGDTILVRLA